MLSTVIKSSSRHLARRSFASSSVTRQAVPTEVKPLNKEFKIYRWVCVVCPFTLLTFISFQNPDEPQKKPELQSYTINLNECGPMVSVLPASQSFLQPFFRAST